MAGIECRVKVLQELEFEIALMGQVEARAAIV